MFIVLDGPEGVGKTTQMTRLAARLTAAGHDVHLTREPGGSPTAEKIRTLVLTGAPGDIGPEAELMLFAAARCEHLRQTVRPMMAAGKLVLCDRYVSSTIAYQGHGHDRLDMVRAIHRLTTGDFWPDLTLILDADPLVSLARSKRRLAQQGSGEDRFEQMDEAFHLRVMRGFRTLAAEHPGIVLVPADGTPDAVEERLWARLTRFIEERRA
jgi:dTMP kinase